MASPTITFRLPPDLDDKIRSHVARLQTTRSCYGRYNLSDFVLDAIFEKLSHLARSRKAAASRRKLSVGEKVLSTLPSTDERVHTDAVLEQAVWGVGT
jgi:Arc/MetJ-type ribon-helix-helix transcriptional regulator